MAETGKSEHDCEFLESNIEKIYYLLETLVNNHKNNQNVDIIMQNKLNRLDKIKEEKTTKENAKRKIGSYLVLLNDIVNFSYDYIENCINIIKYLNEISLYKNMINEKTTIYNKAYDA